MSELKNLAQDCNYGAMQDTMLRDRLVCGIQDDAIQQRLLAEPSTTAFELAQSKEAAAKDFKEQQHANFGQCSQSEGC